MGREGDRKYMTYNKIRAKDGHRHRAKNAKTRYPGLAYSPFFRLEHKYLLHANLVDA